MVKNKVLLLSISIIASLLLLLLVSAAISTTSPLNGTNHTHAALILLNTTFLNNTDILTFGTSQTQINASFYRVNGTQITFLANSSTCSIASGANGEGACWTRFNVSGLDGFYNLTSTIFNATTSRNSSTNITSVYFDSTPPVAFAENFSGLVSRGNYSQNIVLNISIFDVTIGIQSVIFNITNSSGGQNASVTATREGSTSSYSVTINTTNYPDSYYYNITVYVNDSLGNLNNSARIFNLTFDNTKPAASFTCTDYTVEEDDIMNCDCVSSDALSGVASENFDPTPPTSNTGNNQQSTCTVTDYAGNVNTSTISYNVTGSSGTSSGGGSSGSSSSGSTGGTTGSSSSGNSSTTNNTTQNSSSGEANQLQANQQNQNESDFKINYWILSLIVVGAAIAVTVFILIKKGILQRLLKFNK